MMALFFELQRGRFLSVARSLGVGALSRLTAAHRRQCPNGRPYSKELPLRKISEDTFDLTQLRERSGLRDPAAVHDNDPVGLAHRAVPVRDHDPA